MNKFIFRGKRGLISLTLILLVMIVTFAACSSNPTNQTNGAITNYLNTHGHTYKLSSVKTPKNSVIQTCYYSTAMSSSEVSKLNAYYENLIKKNKWDAVKIGDPAFYNCHSYAWYSQSSANKHWINQCWFNPKTGKYTATANLSKYWTDGSYTCIATVTGGSIPSNVPNGSVVFYVNGDHSAIKHSSTKFRSKWGFAGLYVHSPGCAPYSASKLKYYKRNN